MDELSEVQGKLYCGAKTKAGTPCMNPPELGRARCRSHGCAPGSGAPKNNKNRLTHGFYTAEAVAERRWFRKLLKDLRNPLEVEC